MAHRNDDVVPAPDADVCLAFANTRYWRGTSEPTEDLRTPDDLLRWAAKTERLPSAMMKRFEASSELLEDAIEMREVIHRCFAATAAGRAPSERDLGALNSVLADAPQRRRVRPHGWDIGWAEASAGTLLAPVLWSAADLLVGNQRLRVRQCANPACGWLFLDTSKGGNRRWCSMSACGNRAKAHRHYLRRRDAE
jgi:predicted RNA-binding Zn ribbon-like protein